MSEQEPSPLPDELRQLLRTAKAPFPPGGFDARVLARVKSTLAAPPLPDPGGSSPSTGAAPAAKMGAWGVKVSLATLVLGAAAGTFVGSQFLGSSPSQAGAAQSQRELPSPAAPSPTASPAPAPVVTAPPAVVAGPAVAPTPAPPRPQTKKPSAAPARDIDLADERALIELARTSLARREAPRALELLERHAGRFPSGQLSEERDSLWVQALVNLGRYPDARLKAAGFRLEYPDSMLRSAVDAAVQAIPP